MTDNLDPATDSTEATALTLQQHAMQEIDKVAAGIEDLQKRFANVVFDVTTTKGMADAKAARAEIRQVRYDVENTRKEKGAELKRIATAINDRASDITAPIRELEDPIDAQIKAEEDRKEAEREAKRLAEAERIGAMNARLDNIRNMPLQAVGATAEEISQAIEKLDADTLDGFDEVYAPTAQQTKEAALASLTKALDARRALDEQAAELERQRAEQAAREAEAAEQRRQADEVAQAERDRQAAEAQAKADAEAAQRRETQEREDRERAERIAEEDRQRAAQAESDRVAREAEEAKLAEARQKLEAEQAAQREAEAKAEQERQEAAQRAEDERLAREQAEAAERAEAEARAAAQASEEAIDALIENTAADNGSISGDDGESGWYFTTEQLQAFGRALIKAVQS